LFCKIWSKIKKKAIQKLNVNSSTHNNNETQTHTYTLYKSILGCFSIVEVGIVVDQKMFEEVELFCGSG